jgi:hypothetical protein
MKGLFLQPSWFPHSLTRTCASLLMLALLNGCAREISGTYLAKFSDGIGWVQLIRTPDNRLSGKLEVHSLQGDGDLKTQVVPLSGAVNGDDVTISSSFWGLQILTLSGKVGWNRMTLTGGSEGPIVLVRSNLSEYQDQLSMLKADSKRITSARAAALNTQRRQRAAASARLRTEQINENLISEIDRVIGGIQKFEEDADVHLGRFPKVEGRYHEITAKIADYSDRARRLPDSPQAFATRDQLSAAATQASLAADQLHDSGISLRSALQSEIGSSLSSDISKLERICKSDRPSIEFTEAQAEVRATACYQLASAETAFRTKFQSISSGLDHLERVYQDERRAQQNLVQLARIH